MGFVDSLFGMFHAFGTIFSSPMLMGLVLLGTVIGLVSGALPGVTMVVALVLTMPFTLGMPIGHAIIVLFCIYCGGVWGGSITAILFNIPGDPMNVCTTFDGHPMAKRGEAGRAMSLALYSSTFGGMASALVMIFLSPPFAKVALSFSVAEFFAIIFLGLCAVSVISEGSVYLSIISMLIGMFLGTVGVESITGAARFTFGSIFLLGGINWIALLIGMFAVGEVMEMYSSKEADHMRLDGLAVPRVRLPLKDFWEKKWTWFRAFIVGLIVGMIPAAGAAVASFLGYGIEKQISRHPEKFGTGIPEGVIAPETADNASTGGAMIPLLTLGIPGSAATAVMMGVFMVQGIQPGPSIFEKMPEQISMIFAGGILANLLMFGLGWLLILPMVKLMYIPKPIMAAYILVFSIFGAYGLRNDMLDVWVMIFSGIAGYVMRRYDYPTASLVLGLILGPMGEDKFMTSMYAHHNNVFVFFTRPISGPIMVFALIILFFPALRKYWAKRIVNMSMT